MTKKCTNKLYYVFSNWGNAHQMARLIGLEEEGVESVILAYVRNIYPSGVDRDIIELGKVSPGSYANRIVQYLKALRLLIRSIPSGATTFVFGFDNLLLLVVSNLLSFKKRKIVYEIADIQPFQLNDGLKGRVVRYMEKQLFKYIDLAVVTSPEFITGFYKAHQYPDVPSIWLENKMNTFALKQVKSAGIQKAAAAENNKATFTIGLFGMIRCQRSIEILDQLTKEDDRFRLIIRGVMMPGVEKLKPIVLSNRSFLFLGSYISPTDLKEMYSEIDLAWIAYPYTSKDIGNWRWARTNRFYEAGYYKIPMIASSGTQDGERVVKNGIGLSINLADKQRSVNNIQQITKVDINNWKSSLNELTESTFVVTDDYLILKQKLIELNLF